MDSECRTHSISQNKRQARQGGKYFRPIDYHTPTEFELIELADPDNAMDAFPDDYYYRIPGKSGCFIFKDTTPPPSSSPTYRVATIPYEPIKVGYSDNGSNPYNSSFSIIDDNGIQYEFKAVETTNINDKEGCPSYDLPTSWKCTKIINPKGEISFSYTENTSTAYSLTAYAVIEDELFDGSYPDGGLPLVQQHRHGTDFKFYYVGPGDERSSSDSSILLYAYDLRESDISPSKSPNFISSHSVCNKKINNITFPHGSVSFNMSSVGTLTSIIVKDVFGNTIRTITFIHDQSSDGYPFLKSVTIAGGGMDEKYNFVYWGTYPQAIRNGNNFISRPLNLWGYNSSSLFSDPIPRQPAAQIVGNMYPSQPFYMNIYYRTDENVYSAPSSFGIGTPARFLDASGHGMLRTITTKSGAITEFEYESDAFRNTNRDEWGNYVSEGIVNSGGLRIKKITQRDHTNSILERHFKYGIDESGLGEARISIDSKYFTSTKTIELHDNGYRGKWRQRILQSSIKGDITLSGVPIVYSYVTEYIKSGEKDFGKTVYHYNWKTGVDYFWNFQTNLPVDNREFEWGMGQLISRDVYKYDEATSDFSRILHTTYYYSTPENPADAISAGQTYISSSLINNNPYGSPLSKDVIEYVGHTISPGANRFAGQRDTLFNDDGTRTITNISYYYGILDSPNKKPFSIQSVITKGSDGTEHIKTFKYPKDVTGREDQSVIGTMISKNILTPIVEQIESVREPCSTVDRTIRTIYNYYKTVDSMQVLNKISVKDENGAVEDRIVYNNYDSYGNPIFITKDNLTNVVYLRGYQGQYLVAKIENATYTQVKSVLGSVSLEASSITEGDLTTLRNSAGLQHALITTYKYKPLVGIVEVTDPRGIKASYDYDTMGRLSLAKDHEENPVVGYTYGLKY